MPCEHIGGAIVCRGRKPVKPCGWCPKPHTLLCDWIVAHDILIHGKPKTCDKPLCSEHAQEVAPNKHLCPEHQEAYEKWQADHRPGDGPP